MSAYQAVDPEPVVKVMAEATFPAIGNGRHLASDLRTARARWAGLITARRGAAAHRLADLLIQHPVVNMPLVARELSLATSSAQRATTVARALAGVARPGSAGSDGAGQTPLPAPAVTEPRQRRALGRMLAALPEFSKSRSRRMSAEQPST